MVFGFSNSIPYGLEESRELCIILVEFSVNRHSKIQKISQQFFSLFLSRHYGFTNYFVILNFAYIPRIVLTC